MLRIILLEVIMLKKIFYLFFPIMIGSIIGFVINKYIDYSILIKPPLSPPKLLFPIMQSIIYLLLGISCYLYKKNSTNNKVIDYIYYLQLIVNYLWSFIFFVWKLRFIAVIWIILLLILVISLYKLYYNKYKISAYLLILYIIWTMFATYLTIGIYILN